MGFNLFAFIVTDTSQSSTCEVNGIAFSVLKSGRGKVQVFCSDFADISGKFCTCTGSFRTAS